MMKYGPFLLAGGLMGTLVEAQGNVQEALCYEIDYDYDATTKVYASKTVVRPVTGFPAEHAMVKGGYCGTTFQAGDPIPFGESNCTNCKFPRTVLQKTFDSCPDDTDCIEPSAANSETCQGYGYVNAGTMFYAFGVPSSASSNTGYQLEEASDVYFIQDTHDQVFLVLNHDKPQNRGGGSAHLAIESTGLGGKTFVAQEDDVSGQSHYGAGQANACAGGNSANSGTDCFAWDETLGKGTFAWHWQSCCTDGLVIGPMPKDEFSLTLAYSQLKGLEKFRFGDYVADDGSVSYEEEMILTDAKGVLQDTQFLVKAFTCSDYCQKYDFANGDFKTVGESCHACDTDKYCSWCKDGNGGEACLYKPECAAEDEVSTCPICPAGYYCPVACTDYEKCKIPCPAGFVCPAGTLEGDEEKWPCDAGYWCPAGTSEETEHAHPCDDGYYCPAGTSDTTKDRHPCDAGYYCPAGTTDDDKHKWPCDAAYYCPAGTGNLTKHNHPCDAGYYCPAGMSDVTMLDHPCDEGFYCLIGTSDVTKQDLPCPAGTYSDKSGAKDVTECDMIPCEVGFYCLAGTSKADKQKLPCPPDYNVKKEGLKSSDECSITALCYRVWHDYDETAKDFQQRELMRPVAGFPEKHAMVTEGYCGGATAGDPLPHGEEGCTNCKFGADKTFDGCPTTTLCVDDEFKGCRGEGYVNAGSMFYAYNYPEKLSSNTGYAKEEASDLYFIQDDANEVFLVMNHDKPDNKDGGNIKLSIDSEGLNGETYVAQMDDFQNLVYTNPDQCKLIPSDCFAWDSAQGKGTFSWQWAPCCTDGMVLGPMPKSDTVLNLDFREHKGLEEIRLGSYGNNNRAEMSFKSILPDDHKYKIEGFTCEKLCWEEFKLTFGAPAFGGEPEVKPKCGNKIPDVKDLPTDGSDEEKHEAFAKALREAVVAGFDDFGPEDCSDACSDEVERLAETCKGVTQEWAKDLVEDLTPFVAQAAEICEDNQIDAASALSAGSVIGLVAASLLI